MTNEEATPRPWKLDESGMIMSPNPMRSIHSVIDDVAISYADAALIVEAVNGRDALLAENAKLRKALGELSFELRLLTGITEWNHPTRVVTDLRPPEIQRIAKKLKDADDLTPSVATPSEASTGVGEGGKP